LIVSSLRPFNNDDDNNNDPFDALLDDTLIDIPVSIASIVILAVIIRGAILDGGNSNVSGSGAFLGNSSFDTIFLDNSSIDSDDDTDDKDLFDWGNNNGSGDSASADVV